MSRREIRAEEKVDASVGRANAARGVIIDEAARNAIDEHVASDLQNEKGGVLVGDVDPASGVVTIVATIPAHRATSAPASLTFTHDAWDEVNEVLGRDYPGRRMVGWYHSHPRFGIFLSEYDTFIQSNFFSTPAQLAYVVDPVYGQSGFFGWEGGRIVRLQQWAVLAHGSAKSVREPERGGGYPASASPALTGPTAPIRGPVNIVTLMGIVLVAVLVGLVGGFFLGGRSTGTASTASRRPPVVRSYPLATGLVVTRTLVVAKGIAYVYLSFTNTGFHTLSGDVDDCAPKGPGLSVTTSSVVSPSSTTPTSTVAASSSPMVSCRLGTALEAQQYHQTRVVWGNVHTGSPSGLSALDATFVDLPAPRLGATAGPLGTTTVPAPIRRG